MARPLVTVLIDTYNHERFIEEAIASVLAQDFPASEMEILVVDDGSTDRTPEIVQKFAPRVRYLRKENGGQASAFNFGIPQAQGEIVAFLDGDDWWAPNKLSRVTQAMAADPSVGIVGHGIITVNLDGRQQIETLLEGFRFQANSLEGARLFRRRGAFLGTSRMTIRAGLLRQIGPIPEAIRIQADEFLFTLAAVLTTVLILPQALTYYRLHEANLFQLSGSDPLQLRRKQQSLSILATALSQRMDALGIGSTVRHGVLAYTQAYADQLRLMLDGGNPWETAATEWRLYRVTHPDAPRSHRVFKFLSLIGALGMTPKTYYAAQRAFAQSETLQRARKRWLPIPEMPHIQKRTDL
jgi:glycosyltransferase involved in cell wall biosynthesis